MSVDTSEPDLEGRAFLMTCTMANRQILDSFSFGYAGENWSTCEGLLPSQPRHPQRLPQDSPAVFRTPPSFLGTWHTDTEITGCSNGRKRHCLYRPHQVPQ